MEEEAVRIKKSILQTATVNYDHIELTPEEIEEVTNKALLEARKKKATAIYEREYALKLRTKAQYPVFDFDALKKFVLDRYPKYSLDSENELMFDRLCMYFSNDPLFEEEEEGFSLSKGIMLRGPVGCGKTTLMSMFSLNTHKPFKVVPCRKISDAYVLNGTQALYMYSDLAPDYPQRNFGHDKLGQCFDDLGTEENKKNFGNSVNVMQDVLYKIYDEHKFEHFHITTNIIGDQIEEFYGLRIRSRLREMFNVLDFDTKAKDRRK